MKTTLLLLLLWSSANAQNQTQQGSRVCMQQANSQETSRYLKEPCLYVGDQWTAEVIILKTDTMTVAKSFELLDKLCKGKMWYWDRKVIYQGETYFQFGLSRKKKTWKIDGNRMRRV